MARVLLIEDDEPQRLLAKFSLGTAGHEVHEAPDGAQGLAMVRQVRPEIVVCDVLMPGMNGFEVLQRLRADAETSALPVVMLTAMSGRGEMRKGMSHGADDYLAKPYEPHELVEAVAAALARHSVRYEAAVEKVKKRFLDALDRQEQILTARYEGQLEEQLASRWQVRLKADGRLAFRGATLLLADVFRVAKEAGRDAKDPAALAATLLQGTRDTLFVFGAAMVVPYGEDVLAVFDSSTDSPTAPASARAARAAFALTKALDGVAIGMQQGDLDLLQVADPLHGDGTTTPVPCRALDEALVLRQTAGARGWGVAAASGLADGLPEGTARVAEREGSAVRLRKN